MAANTGAAGAMHRVACFAGLPAPTGTALASGSRCTCGSGFSREHRRSRCHAPRRLLRVLARSHRYCAGFGITLYLWERPWPRTPAQPVPCTASPASRACPLPQVLRWLRDHAVLVGAALAANTGAAGAMHRVACFACLPAPTGIALASGSRCTCGSGFSREHRRSRCHAPRRLLRVLARSHRYCAGFGITLYLWERPWPRTPAQPVPCTASPASRACPLPQVLRWLRDHAVLVGAALAANTGAAGAMHRVACFACLPAPTGIALASGSRCTCGSGRGREHRRSRCHAPRRLLRGLARSHRYCAGFKFMVNLWERL